MKIESETTFVLKMELNEAEARDLRNFLDPTMPYVHRVHSPRLQNILANLKRHVPN